MILMGREMNELKIWWLIKKKGKKKNQAFIKSKLVTSITVENEIFFSRKRQTILFPCDFRIKVNAFLKIVIKN